MHAIFCKENVPSTCILQTFLSGKDICGMLLVLQGMESVCSEWDFSNKNFTFSLHSFKTDSY